MLNFLKNYINFNTLQKPDENCTFYNQLPSTSPVVSTLSVVSTSTTTSNWVSSKGPGPTSFTDGAKEHLKSSFSSQLNNIIKYVSD